MATATILPKAIRNRIGFREAPHTALCPRLFSPQRWLETLPQSVPVPGLARNICVKFASTRQEWEEAFELVGENYMMRGYQEAGANLRFTGYHALPDTVVLVAKAEGRVVATFSLVADNTLLGLPMEGIYDNEINDLRHAGRNLFETGSLADRGLSPREFIQVFFALQRLGWQYQVRQGADTTVITVNPRHRNFYVKMLGFVPMGRRRAYPTVQGHPAEACFIDPRLMQAKAPKMHEQMFGQPLPVQALVAPRMPADLIYHFAARSSQTQLGTVQQIMWNVAACGSPRRW